MVSVCANCGGQRWASCVAVLGHGEYSSNRPTIVRLLLMRVIVMLSLGFVHYCVINMSSFHQPCPQREKIHFVLCWQDAEW